ncbi:MAG: chorismate lyase [Sulfurisoma sp.]|nr:chorismate lyase [Sulfurisoma sp.]
MQTWLPRPAVRGPLRHWLTARGSLSERLRAASRTGFSVQRLNQGLNHVWPDEREALRLSDNEQPLVREVLLFCGTTPVVFARSLAAARHLDGPWRSLRGLGSRPLATMLFADPRIARGAIEFCRIDGRQPLHHRAEAAVPELPRELWARRSVFRRENAPLLVTEIFLPGVLTL